MADKEIDFSKVIAEIILQLMLKDHVINQEVFNQAKALLPNE